jgi:hypothetical protein
MAVTKLAMVEKRNGGVSAETFVREWQRAASITGFCTSTGMREGSARTRAFTLRKRGVPLKFMAPSGPTRKLDIDALKKLAKESLE